MLREHERDWSQLSKLEEQSPPSLRISRISESEASSWL